MVDSIVEIKNELLKQVRQDMHEKGANRVDKEIVDMIKDMAEAEKYCWEADYYKSVVNAMNANNSGYSNYSRSSMRNPIGYHDAIDTMRSYMRNSDPVERDRMRAEIRNMMEQV